VALRGAFHGAEQPSAGRAVGEGCGRPARKRSLPENYHSVRLHPETLFAKYRTIRATVKTKRNVLVTLGWYDPRLIEGIGRYAREAGWHLEMRAAIEATPPENWRGDGMLANDTAVPRVARFVEAQARLQPTVLIGSNHPPSTLPSVRGDDLSAGREAALHFLDRGYQHFAWHSVKRGLVEEERRSGYVGTLAAAGHTCHLLKWQPGRGRRAEDWSGAAAWLSRELSRLPRPLALFVLDDLLAIDAVQACLDAGLRVPEDVAVLGVANMEVACECSQVPLSSIDENLTEIAYRAARLLDHLMSGGPAPEAPEIVPLKGLVVRRSTGIFAITDPALGRAAGFMERNFHRSLTMEDVAREAGMSLRALHYIFRRELQRSPGQHLLRLRLDRARELVEAGKLRMGEVAVQCGFSTLRNFHRAFVRAFGAPPAALRKRNLAGRREPWHSK
jgi:LacI family transcriptional regulator